METKITFTERGDSETVTVMPEDAMRILELCTHIKTLLRIDGDYLARLRGNLDAEIALAHLHITEKLDQPIKII